ncbi:NAD(P)-dependent dehydrogenase, short-chain alcohol dehydrogenase family [Sinomicrobium oceani]|uniref:NAD(P)-dependent dehydrogenase, short-chain alcohol dehydrogenase family n=1 Tax=Sinomicrobium oceani TaxID=1150368 RepID=A0A1K1QCD2_9FLAO|nr:SDR family oxidoreductase [Sinomicrobium oceani]SFW57380.1 NAD(P)-dependent dehydrogenase, short-chain alcohol dehydrogenase family [Sinomicrobium oceani]
MSKNVIITGGGSGIGAAITRIFLEKGHKVFMLERNTGGAKEAFAGTEDTRLQIIPCDVSNQAQVVEIINGIAGKTTIDILINNAGVSHIGTVETTSEQDMDNVFAVNVKGVYNCIHAAIPHMKKNGGGVILNMASIASHVGIADRFAYSMTKGAVLAMTYSVAKDYVADGIRCNSISPARVHTPFVDGFLAKNYPGKEKEMYDKLSKTQPIGRMAKPEEVGKLAYFLCSEDASFTTGTDYPLDGGFIRLNS